MEGPDGRITIGNNASEHTMTTANTGLENLVDSQIIKGIITCTQKTSELT
jgi:hypothetical protein